MSERTPEEVMAEIRKVDDEMGPLYARRRELRNEYLLLAPPAALPSQRRNRTETQERVARCPRCGTSLEDPERKD